MYHAQAPIVDKNAIPQTGNMPIYNNIQKTLDLENAEIVYLSKDDGIDLLRSYTYSNLQIYEEQFVDKNFI